jgi:hypothetical protein
VKKQVSWNEAKAKTEIFGNDVGVSVRLSLKKGRAKLGSIA